MTLAEPVLVRGRPARLLFVHGHPDDESLATCLLYTSDAADE